jgi:hypothetical protein
VTGIVADPPRLSVTVIDPGLVKDVKVVGPGGTLRLFWMPPAARPPRPSLTPAGLAAACRNLRPPRG